MTSVKCNSILASHGKYKTSMGAKRMKPEMRYFFYDSTLAEPARIAAKYGSRMEGEDKDTKEEISALITDIKGIVSTAKDGAAAAASLNDHLIKDNFRLREQKRTLNTELTAAKKLPDGAKIIQKDDAAEFDKFKALGVKVEDIPTLLTENKTLKVSQNARDAADALGWKFKPLQQLLADKNLRIEMRDTDVEEEKDGKKEKIKKSMPFVLVTEGKDTKAIRLDEYEPLKDFHTSLVMDESAGAGAGGRTTQGVRMPVQTGSNNGAGSKTKRSSELSQAVSNTLESRYKRPEPANSGGKGPGNK